MPQYQQTRRRPRKLVLCFDGTGNKFHGDDSDSNILKIFRMLDRTADDQYHYYQPGIGTYVVSKDLSHTSISARFRSWYMKAKDSAIGSSFDHHVVGGYRFLMRFYCPGDEIYIFGFSRGAYIARFLAEMLDYVGLLSHGNEEMVHFAWKAFSQWQVRRDDDNGGDSGDGKASSKKKKKKGEMYEFMKGFRETFSRPVRRIRFLGLFDTVNSVPRFETAWMERSKFPYTARSSAKVIRHAVSIDERRAKFRQDLIYQSSRNKTPKAAGSSSSASGATDVATSGGDRGLHGHGQVPQAVHEKYRRRSSLAPTLVADAYVRHQHHVRDDDRHYRGRKGSSRLEIPGDYQDGEHDEGPVRYRRHSRSRSRATQCSSNIAPDDDDAASNMSRVAPSDDNGYDSEEDGDETEQDIDEVWFAGGHGDVGGGWEIQQGSKSASHVPLTWMVREAMRAGLTFDEEKLVAMGCYEVLQNSGEKGNDSASRRRGTAAADATGMFAFPVAQTDFAQQHQQRGARQGSTVPNIQINSLTPVASPTDEDDRSDPTLTATATRDSPPTTITSSSTTPVATTASPSGPQPHSSSSSSSSPFHEMMHRAHLARLHDSLDYACGLGLLPVLSWKLMEYMPFRRMDLQEDGSWRPIRWPLPCGEVRDVPDNVRVHGSVVRRMRRDESYRPGNLIVGGGGRGCRVAPRSHGMGEWVCVAGEGDPVGEVWMKKSAVEEAEGSSNKAEKNGLR
ncbi:uncharacterized protein E0L32_005184 [Thyridium curvatum]|uniref:T6SS Phospholipase effector Tle1-like catalytic domain-containing protein n=1 Tax=Thyridium curvatum TaxID=1093900 RepID=A0A507BBM8_9PEZI|nr:uncharacterized protein E0L32_005184 [Thyridium curvatum]TPX14789.1 hypothetical protein E0L32_005184 [Thyridium curvatum]